MGDNQQPDLSAWIAGHNFHVVRCEALRIDRCYNELITAPKGERNVIIFNSGLVRSIEGRRRTAWYLAIRNRTIKNKWPFMIRLLPFEGLVVTMIPVHLCRPGLSVADRAELKRGVLRWKHLSENGGIKESTRKFHLPKLKHGKDRLTKKRREQWESRQNSLN